MSLKQREKRINIISKKWKLKKVHSLIARYKIEEDFFEEFNFKGRFISYFFSLPLLKKIYDTQLKTTRDIINAFFTLCL